MPDYVDITDELTSQDSGPRLGVKQFLLAEGHGKNNRRWLVFGYESGLQYHEMRLYGPPSCRAPIYHFTADGKPSPYHCAPIYDRAEPILPLALQWIANPLPLTLQLIKDRYEDERD